MPVCKMFGSEASNVVFDVLLVLLALAAVTPFAASLPPAPLRLLRLTNRKHQLPCAGPLSPFE